MLCMPHRRLNKLQVTNGKHRMLMHAITYARSAFLVSEPLDAHMRIIQQIKRQCDRANYMSYCTRWKWKLTRTSFNGQLSRTVLLVTLHSWNGITGTDPIPVSFALRDRKITLGRSMARRCQRLRVLSRRTCPPGEILYERSANRILVNMSKLAQSA